MAEAIRYREFSLDRLWSIFCGLIGWFPSLILLIVSTVHRYLTGVFVCAYKNQTVKDSIFAFILQIIASVKTNEVDKIVDSLTEDELDVMMKYIYKAFEHPSAANCANLLVWHDKVFNKAGVGSIVRVLTDKKRV